MSERELLELAAKAAGITLRWDHPYVAVADFAAVPVLNDGAPWDPLVNDADALRLAVDLNLHVWISNPLSYAGTDGPFKIVQGHDPTNGIDRYAATRRAIVRAAAEIGRQMK